LESGAHLSRLLDMTGSARQCNSDHAAARCR
jgi:hypothetical protein